MGIAQQWQEEEKSFVNKKWMFISQMKPCYYKEVLLFFAKFIQEFIKILEVAAELALQQRENFAVCVVCLKCCTNTRPLKSAL